MKKFHRTNDGKLVKSISADGQKGYLLNFNGEWHFRVYASSGKPDFIDYPLYLIDLHVQIDDVTASFYTDANGNKWLGYSPKLLGLPRASKRSPKKTAPLDESPSR
jgi:hypothetical protein